VSPGNFDLRSGPARARTQFGEFGLEARRGRGGGGVKARRRRGGGPTQGRGADSCLESSEQRARAL
jgi:hypothetical protein